MTESIYKIITLGDSGVGKTTLLYHIAHQRFAEVSITSGVQMFVSEIVKPNKKITLNMWDTAGQERFKNINKIYSRGSDIVIIIYANDSQESFDSIPFWVENVEGSIPTTIPIILVCTKTDLAQAVSKGSVEKLMEKYNFDGYFEVSSKQDQGVIELVDSMLMIMNTTKLNRQSFILKPEGKVSNDCKC